MLLHVLDRHLLSQLYTDVCHRYPQVCLQKQILKKKSSNIQKGFKVQFLHQEEENKISLNVGIGTGGTMNDAEI